MKEKKIVSREIFTSCEIRTRKDKFRSIKFAEIRRGMIKKVSTFNSRCGKINFFSFPPPKKYGKKMSLEKEGRKNI